MQTILTSTLFLLPISVLLSGCAKTFPVQENKVIDAPNTIEQQLSSFSGNSEVVEEEPKPISPKPLPVPMKQPTWPEADFRNHTDSYAQYVLGMLNFEIETFGTCSATVQDWSSVYSKEFERLKRVAAKDGLNNGYVDGVVNMIISKINQACGLQL